MKKFFAVLSAVALAVSLTACASSAEPEAAAPSATEAATPSPKPTPGKGNIASDGTDFTTIKEGDLKSTTDIEYSFITGNNTMGTIEFVDSTDPRVKDIEKYLKDATGYHREYIIADVDNRKGTEVANMYSVKIYDEAGSSYEFTNVYNLIEDAKPVWNIDDTYTTAFGDKELTEAEYRALSDRGSKLSEAQTWAIDPLEKATFILALEIDEGDLPKEITGVSVMAHGAFDEVPAHNPLASEYREWMAAQEAGVEWEAYDASTAEPMPSE